jgi:hypothetical protein
LNKAFAQAIAFDELEPRTTWYDANATKSEWEVMKKNFKAIKTCPIGKTFSCWVDADRICTGSCSGANVEQGKGGVPIASRSEAFIDASGRAWAQYTSDENIYLVDINGDKKPNQFGKDRWQFSLRDVKNNRIEKGLPAKILPYAFSDITVDNGWCNHSPCYYKSWLVK